MRFNNTKVFNLEGALRGMRNPMNSWVRSDSYFDIVLESKALDAKNTMAQKWAMNKKPNLYTIESPEAAIACVETEEHYAKWLSENGTLSKKGEVEEIAYIGPNDLALAQKLIMAGPEHRKFLRQIGVSVDITAPIYW